MAEGRTEVSRKKSVLQLAGRYDPEPVHSQQVARLALKIFDQTACVHGLDDGARELLEYASLLHDIGWSGGDTKHKRRSYEIIKSAPLDGFSGAEKEIIATVARYHGTKAPEENQTWDRVLSPEDKAKVRCLSAVIRVADALDRGHAAVIEDIECSIAASPSSPSPDCPAPHEAHSDKTMGRIRIVLKIKTSADAEMEMWALARKKSYFEEVFQVELEVARRGGVK